MNRRQALKNLGFGAGIMVVGPTTLGLLQSCKNERNYEWEPTILNAAQGFALTRILDVILPTTDTPGAGDLNIAQFLDSYINEVASEESQKEFMESADAFAQAFEERFDKSTGEGSQEEYEEIIAKYLRATPEERDGYARRNTETQDPQDKDPAQKAEADAEVNNSGINADAGAYSYLENVREMAIWAWKTSEEVGENVLWYDPIPGEYIPCGPVEELGGGKAMSL
ncbi:gluconate 2-dehydrogenase subunit 3 family protein [Salegentibacter sp. F188]|uniref:Gluconate 2-dehydrogenase subunit 3 family protein n=1 Tax=Autumnicola patrickiae TaxID=3075591 RepID=A0ABU3E6R2_9FLAO|nr:gluconate 2-dehydrogenase subunit 3 family protein [Salegentibacter sp. F188]MDT0691615.1 gluconate 2-dehydrogenase subunit 3 family protein [Salegentibacter sp. F188]